MEELLNKLETINYIRNAISQTYNEIINSDKYIESMELINDLESDLIRHKLVKE